MGLHHRGHATEAGSLCDRCVSKGAIFNLERVSGYNFVPCGPRVPGSESELLKISVVQTGVVIVYKMANVEERGRCSSFVGE